MKHQKRRHRGSKFEDDPDFAAALTADESREQSTARQAERKARQLCRQVQRALNLALESRGEDAGGWFVEQVSPAPDCARLLAHVVVPEGRPAAECLAALRRETPRLRAEVAMAISRKRAPELAFALAPGSGGGDE